jgi:hypothetical protein
MTTSVAMIKRLFSRGAMSRMVLVADILPKDKAIMYRASDAYWPCDGKKGVLLVF